MKNDNTPALSPIQMHAELSVKIGDSLRGDRPLLASIASQRDEVMKLLVDDGWLVLGVPPCRQVLADARQFHDELVLTKLVARFFRVLILGGFIVPDTVAAMDWLRDYIDGNHSAHGPLGKPMIWPDRVPSIVQLLREWGFQPTPTRPPYVSLRPGGKMLKIDYPEPDAPDPRMVEPIDANLELRMASLLDSMTQGVICAALDRTTVLRAMAAAWDAGRDDWRENS